MATCCSRSITRTVLDAHGANGQARRHKPCDEMGHADAIASSQNLVIDNDAGTFCHAIVEAHCNRIGLMSLPIDTIRACGPRGIARRSDQRATDSLASRGINHKQVLEVARRGSLDGASVKEEVRQTEQLAVAFGNECVQGLARVKEA